VVLGVTAVVDLALYNVELTDEHPIVDFKFIQGA
jgi:hypothetical protein